MYVCEKCGGNCDPGELSDGICTDCREKEQARRADQGKGFQKYAFIQMDLFSLLPECSRH